MTKMKNLQMEGLKHVRDNNGKINLIKLSNKFSLYYF